MLTAGNKNKSLGMIDNLQNRCVDSFKFVSRLLATRAEKGNHLSTMSTGKHFRILSIEHRAYSVLLPLGLKVICKLK